MRGERGFALVITLIVTALLVALLAEFVNETYVDTSHSHNFVAAQQAGVLAESGAVMGKKLLMFELGTNLPGLGHPEYSSLMDMWAKGLTKEDETGTLKLTIEEESGKLNLNTTVTPNGTPNEYSEMAKRLLRKAQLSADLFDALMDWRDENDTPGPGGAETSYYGTLKPPYAAKNASLESVEELGLIKGFDPKTVARLKPLVTVYGETDNDQAPKVNINTARREVIAALDQKLFDNDGLVDRIVEYRKTNVIKSSKELNSIAGIGDISTPWLGRIGYKGSVFRIRSEGRVGESVSIVEAVVRLNGTTAETLYWREY